MNAVDFYDALETRDPEAREEALLAALPGIVDHAKRRAPGFGRLLADVDPRVVTSRAALARLPVTRKSELSERQAADPPFGGLAATRDLARIYASPGPIYDPEGRGQDYWRMARALHAAGFRRGDLVHNAFSYHFTPAGMMMDLGAQALGCTVLPAGTGQTEAQVAALRDLRPHGYAGTPSFLRILLEKGDELGIDLTSLQKALVSGEAFPAAARAALEQRGIRALQCYASADLGLIAYESTAQSGLIVDEGVIVEIVRPGTGDPVDEGDVGEVVVTTLTPDYPLIRFATGDLSALLPGTSPCGRTNARLKGWLGRADQTTKVRGMFVHPGQVAQVVRRHPEIRRCRLVVDTDAAGHDRMTLHCEADRPDAELAAAIAASLRELCKLRGDVAFAPPGSLPGDGKIIEDARKSA